MIDMISLYKAHDEILFFISFLIGNLYIVKINCNSRPFVLSAKSRHMILNLDNYFDSQVIKFLK